MSNPLLDMTGLPPFSEIKPEHIEPAIDQVLSENRALVGKLLAENVQGWDNLIQPLEDMDHRLERIWSPVSHLNAVKNSDAIRAAYNACLPKLSEYAAEMGQNRPLFEAFREFSNSEEYTRISQAQRKIIENALRDFRLSGVDLTEEKRARYKEIAQDLSRLTSKFDENVLDATNAWSKLITNEKELAGLPASALGLAHQTAEQNDQDGWLFNLQFPSYLPVQTYADNRALRQETYEAFVTRASDQGPDAGKWDNSEIIDQVLQLRHEKAQLLGFENYAELSLETKMASNGDEVLDFLLDLAGKSRSYAEKDLDQIRAFAKSEHGVNDIQAWDITYYGEKLRQHRYELSQEDVRAYFPAPQVIEGMFEVVKRLYGLSIEAVTEVDCWHPDVSFYTIRDDQNDLRGQFYLDLYARENKRGGAWMADCVGRRRLGDYLDIPVAFLSCNFSAPVGQQPSLLTHDEVQTLFHEFGHGLHHMLTQVDYPGVAGINGVPWDAVELPSQFMENWCWDREALDLIGTHFETGKKLPEELFNRMFNAKNYLSGMQMVRQLEFGIFDFRLHREYDPAKGARVYPLLEEVRAAVAVIQPPAYNRFPNSFSHIFAGGYAAGYYSYKWAEVLSADAFSLFEENGIFDAATGHKFLTAVLEQGGSCEPMELFTQFRGREPNIDALLRHSGMKTG